MKTKLHLGRGAAILACVASLAGTAVAVAPTAASAAGTNCGNKSIKIPVEGGKAEHLPVKAIVAEGGVTCTEAVRLIGDLFAGELPSGWKSLPANFEPPVGLIAQELKKGSKVVKYAVRGG